MNSLRTLYRVFWSRSFHHCFPDLQTLPALAHMTSCLLRNLFLTPLDQFMFCTCPWAWGHPLKSIWPTGGHTFKGNMLPQQLSVAHSSSATGGVLFQPSSPWQDFVWLSFCRVSCMLSQPLSPYLCSFPVSSGKYCFTVAIHFLRLLLPFCPIFWDDTWDLGGWGLNTMSYLGLRIP